MAQSVRELRVFLASPGDVIAEREAVREVAERVNATFEERGVRVRIVGWERVRSELGRPQGLINPHVHKCDVFIALLNRRWGSDSGLYTSGFEEEFEVALERRRTGDTPAIGMFFAELPGEVLADPGPQLRKVIAFQERVRTEKLGIYKQYVSSHHLETEVLDFLTGHALELADSTLGIDESLGAGGPTSSPPNQADRQRAVHPNAEVVVESPQSGDDAPAVAGPDTNSAALQIAEALRSFAQVFEIGDGDLGTSEVRDRVTLVGTSFAVDEQLLGAHHVNRLYQRRADLHLTNGEVWTWLRTYFADRHPDRAARTVPVWGLLRPGGEGGADVRDDLVKMASNEDRSVARGALAFMAEYRVRPPVLWPGEAERDGERGDLGSAAAPVASGEGALRDGSAGGTGHASDSDERRALDVAVAFWVGILDRISGVGAATNYLAAVATQADLQLLDALVLVEELNEASRPVVSAVADFLRGDPRPLAVMAPSQHVDDVEHLIRHIHQSIQQVSEPEWEALLKSRNRKLSVPAALELAGLSPISEQRALALLRLNDLDVDAALAAQARDDSELLTLVTSLLQDSKGDLDERQQRSARLMAAAVPLPIVRGLADMEPSFRLAAWEALTIQDPQGMAEQAREVLDGRSAFLDTKTAGLRDDYPTLLEHVYSNARRAACTLLSNPTLQATDQERESDVTRVIKELEHDDLWSREAALSAVCALVDESLVDRVPLEVIDGYWVTDHEEELLASPLATVLASRWRTSKTPDLRTAAARWHVQRPERTDEELEEATYDDDMDVRVAAVDVILANWNRDDIEAFLNRYGQHERRWWYNVIAALDEYLYGFGSAKRTIES